MVQAPVLVSSMHVIISERHRKTVIRAIPMGYIIVIDGSAGYHYTIALRRRSV